MYSLRQIRLRPLAMLVDACIVINAYALASLVLFARWAPLEYYEELLVFIPIAVLIHGGVNLKLGLYRGVGRYAGIHQGLRLSRAAMIVAPLLLAAGIVAMPSSWLHVLAMVPIGGGVAFILMAGVRFYPRIFYERSLREVEPQVRMLIVGAGTAGEMLVSSIQKERNLEVELVGMVDDDPRLAGMEIHGVPIHGSTAKIPQLVVRLAVDEIVIAIPSATTAEFQNIWKICSGTPAATRKLKALEGMHAGAVGMNQIKDVEIEDVLGREPVETDYSMIRDFIRDKVVLITGAGGSIGSELALQISHHNPALVILADRDESALYQIHEKFNHNLFLRHEVCVVDVQLEGAVESVFRKYRPQLVFHAAAYKHVPLMELQPEEAVLNNVKGTWVIAGLAGAYEAECFVNISTDKAVDPVNVMGATKQLGEKLVNEFGGLYPKTHYRSVRFGNVLDSRGSVVPIFREQILNGGPLTVTHPDMTRYFMMIPEAVDLVLQAAAFSEGNVVYVLEMGEPVRIMDLASQMMSIMRRNEPLDIVYTGLRPGEKVNEQLVGGRESKESTVHPMIYRVKRAGDRDEPILERMQLLFDTAISRDRKQLMRMMTELVDSYAPFDLTQVGSLLDFREPAGDKPAAKAQLKAAGSECEVISYQWCDAAAGE